MSTPTKPRGTKGVAPALTRLKQLWLDSFSESQRDFWRTQFASTATQAAIRALLKRELDLTLADDSQLTRFRAWVEEQDALDAEAERQLQDETRALELHPDWTDEQRRLHVINCSLNRAIATGDFKGLGLKAVKVAQAEVTGKTKAQLEQEKLQLARQAEARAQQEFQLAKNKFEFDAAKAALAHASTLKTISHNRTLSEEDKVNQTRQLLFGVIPK